MKPQEIIKKTTNEALKKSIREKEKTKDKPVEK